MTLVPAILSGVKILIECPVCGKKDVELKVKNGIRETLDQIEKQIVVEAMQIAAGNRVRAAKLLNMRVHALRHLVIKHGLEGETFSYL